MDGEDVEMLTTNRGNLLVVIDGYEHRCSKMSSDGNLLLRCSVPGCRGRARSDAEGRNARITSQHCHLPDYAAIEVRKYRSALKAAARMSNESPRNIIVSQRTNSGAIVARGLSIAADERAIARFRTAQHEEFTCSQCGKKFTFKYLLQLHTVQEHAVSDQRAMTSEWYACEEETCSWMGPKKMMLLKHKRDAHSNNLTLAVECPMCAQRTRNQLDLALHASRAHSRKTESYEVITTEFGCKQSFALWMQYMNTGSLGSMVVTTSKPTITYYRCKRRKPNKYCTAFMTVVTRCDNTIQVTYVTGHLGHDGSLSAEQEEQPALSPQTDHHHQQTALDCVEATTSKDGLLCASLNSSLDENPSRAVPHQHLTHPKAEANGSVDCDKRGMTPSPPTIDDHRLASMFTTSRPLKRPHASRSEENGMAVCQQTATATCIENPAPCITLSDITESAFRNDAAKRPSPTNFMQLVGDCVKLGCWADMEDAEWLRVTNLIEEVVCTLRSHQTNTPSPSVTTSRC